MACDRVLLAAQGQRGTLSADWMLWVQVEEEAMGLDGMDHPANNFLNPSALGLMAQRM